MKKRAHGKEKKQVFKGGATRSIMDARYDLVPGEAEHRLAMRFGLGAFKHGANNWKTGDWSFIVGIVQHVQDHIRELKMFGNTRDDNTGAISWAGAALAWYEAQKPNEWKKAMRFLSEVPRASRKR